MSSSPLRSPSPRDTIPDECEVESEGFIITPAVSEVLESLRCGLQTMKLPLVLVLVLFLGGVLVQTAAVAAPVAEAEALENDEENDEDEDEVAEARSATTTAPAALTPILGPGLRLSLGLGPQLPKLKPSLGPPHQAREEFESIDKNGDGFLERDEIMGMEEARSLPYP